MAYFQRRRGSQVTVYYHDPSTGKIARLSRAETRHMDAWSDDEVKAWLFAWEKDHGREVRRALHSTLSPTDELSKLRDAALRDWRDNRPFRDSTEGDYERNFEHIEAYFVREHALLDVRKWAGLVAGFPAFLKNERGLGIDGVTKVCQTLIRFGNYLVRTRIMLQPWLVETPKRGHSLSTPLQHYLTTEEVIAAAQKLEAPWSLAPLLGYFCPLRPQEIFALSREDFMTGEEMAIQTLTHKRLKEKHNLGTKLSVNIFKTLNGADVQNLTKTDYAAGAVNIWHPDGAVAIGVILKTMPSGRLFPGSRAAVNSGYRDKVYEVLLGKDAEAQLRMSAKDWSRLCGVELRLRDVQIELVKDQFRHTSITTTQRYMRIPPNLLGAIQRRAGKQNFDDVV